MYIVSYMAAYLASLCRRQRQSLSQDESTDTVDLTHFCGCPEEAGRERTR